jgi:hypothetical protein
MGRVDWKWLIIGILLVVAFMWFKNRKKATA